MSGESNVGGLEVRRGSILREVVEIWLCCRKRMRCQGKVSEARQSCSSFRLPKRQSRRAAFGTFPLASHLR